MSRRVLCYSPGRTPFQRLMADAVDSGVLDSVDGRFLHGELSIECLTVPTPEEVLASLNHQPVSCWCYVLNRPPDGLPEIFCANYLDYIEGNEGHQGFLGRV